MSELERTVLLTLECAPKNHTLAEIVRENGTEYVESKQLHGLFNPTGLKKDGSRIGNVKGRAGRYELLAGDAALRAATRVRCSCGTTVLVADVTFREAIAAGEKKLVSDRVQQAVLILDGADQSLDLARVVLADTPPGAQVTRTEVP